MTNTALLASTPRPSSPSASRPLRRVTAALAVAVLAAGTVLAQTAPALAAPASSASVAAAPSVTGLETEHLTDPIAVGTATPRFSWHSESDARDQTQSAYRIQVAPSADDLAVGRDLLWDSGKVSGDAQILVPYAGEGLASGTTYAWRVQVWNQDDAASTWSDVATFGTGLLDASDWSAQWVNPAGGVGTGGSYLRGVVSLSGQPTSARLYVSGRGTYERGNDGQGICCGQDFGLNRSIYVPFLNGDRVGDAEYETQPTDSRKRSYYRTYDVASQLKAGENVLGFTIGEDSDVIAQLVVTYADGSTQTFGTDSSWTSVAGPTTRAHKYNGEQYDARLIRAGWDTPTGGGTGWQSVDVVSGDRGVLDAAPNEPMRVIREIAPQSITEYAPGQYLLDFGQNISGRTRLTTTIASGAVVTVKLGEKLSNGRIDNGAIGAQQTATVTGAGAPLVFRPSYGYAGFRYAEVTGLASAPTADTVVAEEIHNDVEKVGTFTSSEDILNRLHTADLQTQVNGLHGIPEDTPTREKRGWMADAHVAAEATMGNYDMAAFYTKWTADIRDAQRPDGRIPDIVPNELGGWENGSDPAWAVAGVLVPYYAWQDYADDGLIAANYDAMAHWVDYVGTTTTDDIVTNPTSQWGNDWLSIEQTDGRLFRTGYYYWGAQIVAGFAERLGKTDDAARYSALADRIEAAINRTFFNGVDSYGSSQFAEAFPLTLGIVPAAQHQRVVDTLVKKVQDRGGKFTGGLPGTHYIPLALEQNGRSDLVLANLRDTTKPGWGYMLDNGPGTIWEDWDGANSLNHPMFTSIDDFLYTAVAGLDQASDSTGYKDIVFAPKVTDTVANAQASRETPYGEAAISWKNTDGAVSMDVSVPFGATATVRLPGATVAGTTESGGVAAEAVGVHTIAQDGDDVVITVGSGDYSFAHDARFGDLVTARDAAAAASTAVAALSDADARAALTDRAAAAVTATGKALAAYRAGTDVDAAGALAAVRALRTGVDEAGLDAVSAPTVATPADRAIDALSQFIGERAGATLTARLSDAVVRPGGTVDLSATLSSTGSLGVDSIASRLSLPGGWTAATTADWTPAQVTAGGTSTAAYSISAPAEAEPSDQVLALEVDYVVDGVTLARRIEMPIRVDSALAVGDVVIDPSVADAGGRAFARVPLTNVRASDAIDATVSVSGLPAGWTIDGDVSVTVPPSGAIDAIVPLVAAADADSGRAVVTVSDGAGVSVQKDVLLLVRGSASCGLDPTGAACLPSTTKLISSFESGTEGWVAGENSSSVASVGSFPNGPGRASSGAKALEVTPDGSPQRGAWRSTSVTLDTPVSTDGAHSLVLDLDSYGGAGSTYVGRVVVTGATKTASVEQAVTPDQWNRLVVPLAALEGEDVTGVTVSFRADGAQAWGGKFQIDAVGLDSSSPSAPNLAQGKSVSAGTWLDGWGWGRSMLTDGALTSTSSAHGYTSDPARASANTTEWVSVDLGSVQPVTRIVLYPRTAAGSEPTAVTGRNFPRDFQLEVSADGSTWTTVGTFTGQTADDGKPRTYRADAGTTGRYVRVWVTTLGQGAPDEGGDANGGHRLQLAEMQVFGVDTDARIEQQPQSARVDAGADVDFRVGVSGDPSPTVVWEQRTDAGWQDVVGGAGTTLRLRGVTADEDGAVFRARVSNGQAQPVYSDEVTLSVSSAKVSITAQPSDVLRTGGDTSAVAFEVGTAGSSVRVQWQRAGAATGWTTVSGATANRLELPFAQVADGDRFRAVVSDPFGDYVVSDEAAFQLLVEPTVSGLPADVAVRPGATVTLTAVVAGSPQPTLQWLTRSGAEGEWMPVDGATAAELPFTAAAGQDGSQWALRATNAAGEVTSDPVSLRVEETVGDETAPLVWDTISGAGDDGWLRSGASVTLEASDDDSGVAAIEYRLGDGDWTAYTAPVALPDGTTAFSYRATDRAGNVAETVVRNVRVDGASPRLSGWLGSDGRVVAVASDGGSGVRVLQYSADGSTWGDSLAAAPADLGEGAQVRAVDRAGNVSDAVRLTAGAAPAPVQVAAGVELVIEANGFAAGSQVAVELHSVPTLLTTATTDANGILSVRVKVPASVEAGSHTIVLVPVAQSGNGSTSGGESQGTVSIPVDVLAVTGADGRGTPWLVGGAAGLTLLGLALFVIARRRRPVDTSDLD